MAHTFGNSARIPATGTVVASNPVSSTFNCVADSTVLWVGIVVAGTTARTGGAPTYNGIALTQAGSKRDAGGTPETHVEQWYLLSPPTGVAHTLTIPNTNTRSMAITVATGKAAAGQLSDFDLAGGAAGSSTNPASSITPTVNGDIAFAVVGNGATTWNPSARTGTQLYDWDAGAWGHGSQYRLIAGTSSTALDWTFGTSEDWAINSVAFKEIPPPLFPPTVTTQAVSGVVYNAATGNGNITALGSGASCDLRGFAFSLTTHADPGNAPPATTAYEFLNSEAGSFGTGAFALALGVIPNRTYFVRAVAHSNAGYSYGAEVSVTTPQGPVRLSASENIPAGGATVTTAQLTAPTGKTTADFQAGKLSDDTNPLAALDLVADTYTELEFSVALAANAPGDVYHFRISRDGIPLDVYAVPAIEPSRDDGGVVFANAVPV